MIERQRPKDENLLMEVLDYLDTLPNDPGNEDIEFAKRNVRMIRHNLEPAELQRTGKNRAHVAEGSFIDVISALNRLDKNMVLGRDDDVDMAQGGRKKRRSKKTKKTKKTRRYTRRR